MNLTLWILQILTALIFGASGFMKIFMFESIRRDVRAFDALPRRVWKVMGMIEWVCVVGLIVPGAIHWHAALTALAALVLALESVVFIGVHVKSREAGPIVMSAVLGLLMAFIAYGRWRIAPWV